MKKLDEERGKNTESREPEIKKANTMPGNTAWEIASLTIAILRNMRKQPNSAQLLATIEAVRIM
jgi:hypothetical protein